MQKLFWIIFVEKTTQYSLAEKISQSFLLFYLGFMVVDKKGSGSWKQLISNLLSLAYLRLYWYIR